MMGLTPGYPGEVVGEYRYMSWVNTETSRVGMKDNSPAMDWGVVQLVTLAPEYSEYMTPEQWSGRQIRKLIALQRRTEEDCPYTAAYMARCALDKNWFGPKAINYIKYARYQNRGILFPGTTMFDHSKIDQWPNVFNLVGVEVPATTFNLLAVDLLSDNGVKVKKMKLAPHIVNSWKPLLIDNMAMPFGVWVIQGRKNTHILTVDESEASRGLVKEYQDKGFIPIGLFNYRLIEGITGLGGVMGN